jgi:hypothetical protein
MMTDRSTEYLTGLMRAVCKLPRETEWVEFKDSNAELRGRSFLRCFAVSIDAILADPGSPEA